MKYPPRSVLELTPDVVLKAYQLGLFPMAESRDDNAVFWIDPDDRGVLPFGNFHIPRSLRKTIRKGTYQVHCNRDFRSVIKACAAPTPARPDTWINNHIVDVYTELYELGHAHSIEAWQDDDLIGGLYGVTMGGVFFGESMFTRAPDASKVAFVDLVMRLQRSGFCLLDTQFVNDHLARFGAIEVPRATYQVMLSQALQHNVTLQQETYEPYLVERFLQDNTHTS